MAVTLSPQMQTRLEVMLSFERRRRTYICTSDPTNRGLVARGFVTRSDRYLSEASHTYVWALTDTGREQARNG